jgi:DnaJ-class molecular chaperone
MNAATHPQSIRCPYCKGQGFKPNGRECKPCMGGGLIHPHWQNYGLAVKRAAVPS